MAYLEELLPEFRKGAKIRCSSWIDGGYIQKDEEGIVNQNNYNTVIPSEDALSDRWEFYKDPELDWQFIIDHKCLCWFWNNLGRQKYLKHLQVKEEYAFRDELGTCWDNCCPVRRDEINFYEDKKDD